MSSKTPPTRTLIGAPKHSDEGSFIVRGKLFSLMGRTLVLIVVALVGYIGSQLINARMEEKTKRILESIGALQSQLESKPAKLETKPVSLQMPEPSPVPETLTPKNTQMDELMQKVNSIGKEVEKLREESTFATKQLRYTNKQIAAQEIGLRMTLDIVRRISKELDEVKNRTDSILKRVPPKQDKN